MEDVEEIVKHSSNKLQKALEKLESDTNTNFERLKAESEEKFAKLLQALDERPAAVGTQVDKTQIEVIKDLQHKLGENQEQLNAQQAQLEKTVNGLKVRLFPLKTSLCILRCQPFIMVSLFLRE